MAAGTASVWTDPPSDALPSHFTRMGFFFWGPRTLGKSFINDWNKQMHALFCSGSESVSVYTAAEWLNLMWLKILKVWIEKAHSLWKIFPLLKHHCLSPKRENVFMLRRRAALPLIFLSSSVCPHCLPLARSLGWAQLPDLKISAESLWRKLGKSVKKCCKKKNEPRFQKQ